MEEAESLDTHREVGLLRMLVEVARKLKALQSLRGRCLEVAAERGRGAQDEGRGKGSEEEEEGGGSPDEEECIWKVLHVLREVSISHSDRVTSWREALRECACILAKSPPEGSNQPPAPTGDSGQLWSRKGKLSSQAVIIEFLVMLFQVENIKTASAIFFLASRRMCRTLRTNYSVSLLS